MFVEQPAEQGRQQRNAGNRTSRSKRVVELEFNEECHQNAAAERTYDSPSTSEPSGQGKAEDGQKQQESNALGVRKGIVVVAQQRDEWRCDYERPGCETPDTAPLP